jgi:hypothetical protein
VGVAVASLASSATVAITPHTAQACGGCFVPPVPPEVVVTQSESVITDEQMILSISMNQTTLYDEITYSGAPASFAWVLPIKGTVEVGLSADILFQTISALTAPTVTSPPENCPAPPSCGGGGRGRGCAGSASVSISVPSAAFGGDYGAGASENSVTVTSQAQVGPYEEVQLHSNDGSALTAWLTSHGYDIPDYTKPVIAAYVANGFDFLALKLVPGEGVQTMQPVRVTMQGAAPSLPLHMVAVGTGAVTGITIYLVADGRWAPSNFPTFVLNDSQLSWDWATSSSNYEALRQSTEATYGGRGWQIESSLQLSQYTLTQALEVNVAGDTNGVGGYSALATSQGDAGTSSSGGDASLPDGGSGDDEDGGDAGVAGDAYGEDGGYVGALSPLQEVANADLGVLLYGIAEPNVWITRMRSDVVKSALSEDMTLEASADQSQISNEYNPQIQVGEPLCPVYDASCNEVGTAPRSQAGQVSGGGSGCSVTAPREEMGTTFALLLGFGGVAAVRGRRKRR